MNIDWNCDAVITPGTVAADVGGEGGLSTMTSFNDWTNISFDGGGVIGVGNKALSCLGTRQQVDEA